MHEFFVKLRDLRGKRLIADIVIHNFIEPSGQGEIPDRW